MDDFKKIILQIAKKYDYIPEIREEDIHYSEHGKYFIVLFVNRKFSERKVFKQELEEYQKEEDIKQRKHLEEQIVNCLKFDEGV